MFCIEILLKQGQYHVIDLLLNSESMKIIIVWAVALFSYWMWLRCPSVGHVFGYPGRHFVNLGNGLWTTDYFAHKPVLCCFDLNLLQHYRCCVIFPHYEWCVFSPTLDSSYSWWLVDEFLQTVGTFIQPRFHFSGYFGFRYTAYLFRALQKNWQY